MEQYKEEFIHFMVEADVLKFGEFTLKSGRKSPFFMNAGAYVTGSQLKRLGQYYAKAIYAKYEMCIRDRSTPMQKKNQYTRKKRMNWIRRYSTICRNVKGIR